MARKTVSSLAWVAAAFGLLTASGCHGICEPVPVVDAPRELQKVSLPPYVIEPPDILLIDAVRVVPLPPYKINPLDALFIQATNTLPNEPISGIYPVEPDGTVKLGVSYGAVQVADLSTDEARSAITKHLQTIIKEPQVVVSLAQSRAMQQIRGEHLVRPDGTIGLGVYGQVYLAGLTLDQAKAAVEVQLSRYLYRPEVSLDVGAYNSKVCYVISDGAGNGEQVVPLPITGSETVLDAVGKVGGLSPVASKKRIWVSRPAPPGCGPDQVLPVDWVSVTQRGQTATNYQVLPGDRVYVMSQPVITFDTYLARIYAPIERTFGIVLLGTTTVQQFNNRNGTNNTNGGL
ncbi:MAG TPA: polysaccharide biosynthesis/export family protein [Gemmataceae bacterium]|jgi:polysaccharide export outer membrane protein|nr:polysaccharide biosynthesis/export family protein [Gemmataceae bacterium]